VNNYPSGEAPANSPYHRKAASAPGPESTWPSVSQGDGAPFCGRMNDEGRRMKIGKNTGSAFLAKDKTTIKYVPLSSFPVPYSGVKKC
jgi:hypothetical protein